MDVMDPLRQMGFHKPLLKQFDKQFHTGNFFSAFSLVMALWNWLWKCCGSCGAPVRRPRGAIRPPDATRGGRSPGRRSATPRRSRDRPPGRPLTWRTRAWRSAPKVVEKQQALGRELAGVAQGVGVGPEAERARAPCAARAPRPRAPGGRCGAAVRVARAGPVERIGWANHGRPVGRLGGVLGHVGGDGRAVAVMARDEDPDVALGSPRRPGQAECRRRRARPRWPGPRRR